MRLVHLQLGKGWDVWRVQYQHDSDASDAMDIAERLGRSLLMRRYVYTWTAMLTTSSRLTAALDVAMRAPLYQSLVCWRKNTSMLQALNRVMQRRAAKQGQRSKEVVAGIMLRNMQSTSDALSHGRLSRGMLIWSTEVVSIRRWRQHCFELAVSTAAKNLIYRSRQVLSGYLAKLRSHATFRAMVSRAAERKVALKTGKEVQDRKLLATVIGHHMKTAAAELHIGRLSRGFGMWRSFKIAAQETRMATFTAHINAFVRHTRRIVLQFGFRQWLIWTWEDRFKTLETVLASEHADLEDENRQLRQLLAASPTPGVSNSSRISLDESDASSITTRNAHNAVDFGGAEMAAEKWLNVSAVPKRRVKDARRQSPKPISPRISSQTTQNNDIMNESSGRIGARSPPRSPSRSRKPPTSSWDTVMDEASSRIGKYPSRSRPGK